MKHAISVMLLAGMAGGAFWYRGDQDPPPVGAKLLIPDPGPAEDELDAARQSTLQPFDIELLSPVDKLPSDRIAERPPEIFTVSEEQPFATSDDAGDGSVSAKKTSIPRSETFEPSEVEPRSVGKPSTAKTETVPQSVEGRPLHIRRFGQGKFHTLIVTGLDGRDFTSVEWADDLADALEQRADLLAQQEFVIIRAANPDGLAAKTRENARGVDLNHNFPTRRFQPKGKSHGPASEPETRALLQTLYEFRPQRVVHLCSTSGKSAVYFNSQAGDVADRLQRFYGLPVERLNFDQLPGSVEEFTDATWNSNVVRLHLAGLPEADIPSKLIPVLMTAISASETVPYRPGAVSPVSTPQRQPSRWQTGPQSSPVPRRPAYQTNRLQRPVLRRGYEELPPPPQ